MKVIFFFIVGLICVVYPIVFFILICYTPLYVIIAFFVWIACCITLIAHSKSETMFRKLYAPIVISILFGVFLSVIIYLDKTELLFDEDEMGACFLVMIIGALSYLPIMYLCGNKLRSIIIENEETERVRMLNECRKTLQNQLNIKRNILIIIEKYYLNSKKIDNLINLLDDLQTVQSNYLKEVYIATENKRFSHHRQLLLQNIAVAERKSFPEKYENIDMYYNSIKQECINLEDKLNSIESLNIKDLKKIQRIYKYERT